MPPHPPHKSASQELHSDDLRRLLTEVATGRLSVGRAISELLEGGGQSTSDSQSPEGVTLDLDRQRRCGFPEVVYGQGKPATMIAEIIAKQQQADQPSLVTRIDEATAVEIKSQFSHARFNPEGRTLAVGIGKTPSPKPLSKRATKPRRHVAVVTAGSTDRPVAAEAMETLCWMGVPFRSFDDIGVAGPDRLLAAVPTLRQASTVIVIAGMEGALPAAVGGHLSVPVFAVPTSVGYGATLGGLTPLMGMLSSCASNVAVVNIDAGFKAAYLSGLVVKGPSQQRKQDF